MGTVQAFLFGQPTVLVLRGICLYVIEEIILTIRILASLLLDYKSLS